MNFRESYVFHCLVIKVLNWLSLRQLVYFITFISACQVLFSSFFEAFLMFVCRSQATCLLYHMFVSLSTIIFVFFKTFQMNFCDSLLISNSFTLSHSLPNVNKFFKFFIFFFVFQKRKIRLISKRIKVYHWMHSTSSSFLLFSKKL